VDGDGLPDLFVTHLTDETNTLWKQGPRGLFQDATLFSGLGKPTWRGTGFGVAMGDFDRDGHLDVAVVNGRVRRGKPVDNPALAPFWRVYGERNQLFANDGTGKFKDVSPANAAFSGTARVSRGLAIGDVFNDGSLALLVTEIDGPARLYRNVAPDPGHWLEVRAVDPERHDRDAYGAEVTVEAGGRRQVRLINPASSYLCSSDPRAHFGLGAADHVDAVEVRWPNGDRQRFSGGAADRRVELRQGEKQPAGW
jgi:enediyne biosynthesis protein E4